MKRLVVVVPFLLLACGDPEPTPEQVLAAENRAIAAVEAAQNVPPVPVSPEPIARADIESHGLSGAGCVFRKDPGNDDPLALALERGAFVKIEGELHRLAPDAGSASLPVMARSRYDGREYGMILDLAEEEGMQTGAETIDYPGRLELRNGRGQLVFGSNGIVQCGS
ncbi:hypothetical protein V5F89_12025 [Pelagerythrobacter marensis]|uniref:Lipoprotein n=1 Tax=Pelagerythrobacter marensis TaxID=543877 RepID=A0ABZ2D231_9SPHN